jgi:hypothetical protein
VGEREREDVEVGEGALDLVLGERRVAGPLHPWLGALDHLRRVLACPVLALDDARVGVERLAKRLETDQLTLAVVIGRDHDLVGVLGDLLQRPQDVLVGGGVDRLGIDQLVDVGLLPVVVLLGELPLQQMTLEPDRRVLALAVGPGVVGHLVGLLGLRRAAEDLGDLLGAVVLLGDDQSHLSGPFRRGRRG